MENKSRVTQGLLQASAVVMNFMSINSDYMQLGGIVIYTAKDGANTIRACPGYYRIIIVDSDPYHLRVQADGKLQRHLRHSNSFHI